jgi:hypothetical protein
MVWELINSLNWIIMAGQELHISSFSWFFFYHPFSLYLIVYVCIIDLKLLACLINETELLFLNAKKTLLTNWIKCSLYNVLHKYFQKYYGKTWCMGCVAHTCPHRIKTRTCSTYSWLLWRCQCSSHHFHGFFSIILLVCIS